MTNNVENRLEQTERLLADLALRTTDNTAAIADNIRAIADNTTAIADNTAAITGLIRVTGQMQEDFAAFITVVSSMQAEIRGLQTESVRIQQRIEEHIAQTNRRLERLEGNGGEE